MTDVIPERLRAALADRYRLERPLGEGGMATVYLAQDLRHERRVAIKVLKPELAAVLGAERFLTEIKTTANLQHPHILALFDSGEADTFLFYVMPYVEGESLRDRLDRDHQMGVDEAVRIAKDVADALDYAHRHGVIHRDIKPANILLHDGRPVVADFGIALAISAAGGGRMTETGLSLGTPHYMSPEQASAERDLSARSDVYSLGCVLYEMLAGEPPHTGPSPQSVLMRILTEEARPLLSLRPTVPPNVAAAVMRAVEKLPADRFESAREFREALEDPAFRFERATTVPAAAVGGVAVGTTHGAGARATWDRRSLVLAGATVILALSTAWLALSRGGSRAMEAEGPVVAFRAAELDSSTFGLVPVAGPGGWLAYSTFGGVSVRAPGATDAIPLAGIGGRVSALTFSPTGEWIAYSEASGPNATSESLRKIPSGGGTPILLGTVSGSTTSIRWEPDGWIYIGTFDTPNALLLRIPENGGASDTLLAPTGVPFVTDLLPGSNGIVFGEFSRSGTAPRIVALDLKTRDTATVVASGMAPRWSPTGHLIYASPTGSVFALPFDPGRMRATGAPIPVLDSLAVRNVVAPYDLSRDGLLAYVRGPASGNAAGRRFSLRLDHVNGTQERIPLPPSDHWDAKFSPDGKRLAYIRDDQVWIYDLDLGTHTQLTRSGTNHHNPAWSPDGKRVAYTASMEGSHGPDIYVRDATGAGSASRLGGTEAEDFPSQWPSDSVLLFYTTGSHGQDVYRLNPNQPDDTVAVLRADWNERVARLSPDRRWIAYGSSEGGRLRLYVRSWPALEKKTLVSPADSAFAGNSFPLWSPDGKTLYYQQGTVIKAARLEGSDSLRVTGQRVVDRGITGILEDLHPDGQRLLVLAEDSNGPDSAQVRIPDRFIVVTNWLSVLRKRLQPGEKQ